MGEHVFESKQRLSQSRLWALQEKAYQQFGIGAWVQRGVPSYITSNPYTARSYAYVVLGFLKDMAAQGQIDPAHPVYIVDLGAGSGRFAFLFLKELFSLLGESRLSHLKIRYVMTDIVEGNSHFWKQHSLLQPYFQSGVADSACFHHAQQEPMHLHGSGEVLDEALLVNPLVAIGNYFFDTIPQDVFRIDKGTLKEGRVTLFVEEPPFIDVSDPAVINHVQWRYSYHAVSAAGYYADPAMDAVLATYKDTLEDSTFLFPIGALQAIRRLSRWARDRLFFIAGDQGVCTMEQVRDWGEPKLALHGSFSIAVSYHAIALYVRHCGGRALPTTYPEPSFVVMAGMLTGTADACYETKEAFAAHIDSFEPRDYWRLVSLAQESMEKPSLEYLLLLIKLGNWDPMTVHALFPALRQGVVHATSSQKRQLAEAVGRVWEHFYPMTPEEGDFVLNLGVLLFDLGEYRIAIDYFERALAISGPNGRALQNIAICRARSGL